MFLLGTYNNQEARLHGLDSLSGTELTAFIAARSLESGIDVSYYKYHYLTALEESRVFDGDDWEPDWNANELEGLDFTEEDLKKYVSVTSSKSRVLADGIDSVIITMTAYEPDQVTPFTGINVANYYLEMVHPLGHVVKKKTSIVNGVASFTQTFEHGDLGTWQIPNGKKHYGNFRILNPLEIDVYF